MNFLGFDLGNITITTTAISSWEVTVKKESTTFHNQKKKERREREMLLYSSASVQMREGGKSKKTKLFNDVLFISRTSKLWTITHLSVATNWNFIMDILGLTLKLEFLPCMYFEHSILYITQFTIHTYHWYWT